MRLVGIQPMVGDHLEWQLTVEPGPEEQEEASILLNLRPAQDPKKALRGVLERPRQKLCNTWVEFAWQINRAT